MRLIILHHDRTDPAIIERHFIHAITPEWEKKGVEVVHAAGTNNLPQADAILLHVDLTVVPQRFLKAVDAYPLTMNRRLHDLRKRSLPGRTHLLTNPGTFDGPVIVKTNLNNGGFPEAELRSLSHVRIPLWEWWSLFRAGRPRPDLSYRIYPHPGQVPNMVWKDRRFVVEQFLPEKSGDQFILREAYFLGHAELAYRYVCNKPVARWQDRLEEDICPVHPEVSNYRKRLGLDYGKIDYILHGDHAIIIDVNKTIGGPTQELVGSFLACSLAAGLSLPAR